jgi:glutamate dehydrogenase (NADP+)
MRYQWTFEKVDKNLNKIMKEIYEKASGAAAEYGFKDNLIIGANIAGFTKVAEAMYSQGI